MEIFRDTGFSVVYDSQKISRVLLDSLARPGKVLELPRLNLTVPQGANPYIIAILRTLLDQQVSFSVLPDRGPLREAIQEYLTLNTGSFVGGVADADFVYSVDGDTHGQVLNLKRGRTEFPEESATIIYSVESVGCPEYPADQDTQLSSIRRLSLRGPGISEKRRVWLRGLGLGEIIDLTKTRALLPLGVDAIFADPAGRIIGLPRTTHIEVLNGEESDDGED